MLTMPVRARSQLEGSPLSQDEQVRGEQIGRRLAEQLAAIINAMPPEHASVRGIGTYLGLGHNVCQRVMTAAQHYNRPLEVLAQAPGIEGLRLFAQACIDRQLSPRLTQSLKAAVDQFAIFIRDTAGSHAKLQRRIEAIDPSLAAAHASSGRYSDEQLRKKMFPGVCGWFGSTMRCWCEVHAVRIAPDEPGRVDGAMLNAYLGYVAHAPCPPLAAAVLPEKDTATEDAPSIIVDKPGVPQRLREKSCMLFPQFSSSPTPTVTTHIDRGQKAHIIDSPPDDNPLDAVILTRFARSPHHNPEETGGRVQNGTSITRPTAELVFDVWLDRELAARSIPSAGMSLQAKSLYTGEGLFWHQRLRDPLTLEVLSPADLKPLSSWPDHAAATRRMFEVLDWPLEEFVGYRVHLPYPAWGSAVTMFFDFVR